MFCRHIVRNISERHGSIRTQPLLLTSTSLRIRRRKKEGPMNLHLPAYAAATQTWGSASSASLGCPHCAAFAEDVCSTDLGWSSLWAFFQFIVDVYNVIKICAAFWGHCHTLRHYRLYGMSGCFNFDFVLIVPLCGKLASCAKLSWIVRPSFQTCSQS